MKNIVTFHAAILMFPAQGMSGLYIESKLWSSEDAGRLQIVSVELGDDIVSFGKCFLWLPPRSPQLCESLKHWTPLAIDGRWKVSEERTFLLSHRCVR